jgi:hypothetical protein
LELDELLGNLDNALRHMLAILSDCIPFHLEDRLAPDYICGFDIINYHVCFWNSTSTNNSTEIRGQGGNQFFIKIPLLVCPNVLALAEQLHIVMHSLDKSKLTHLLGVAHMQTAGMHLK